MMRRDPKSPPSGHESDPAWSVLSALPIIDDRTPERRARWECAIAEIRAGQYERPKR